MLGLLGNSDASDGTIAVDIDDTDRSSLDPAKPDDFEAAYDGNVDDNNYKSRFVATLTYTRRFGEMDIPFSNVYANKSEFLEGTDQQIGPHVGLKYRALDQAHM